MDFTLEKYHQLLETIRNHKKHRIRHDVDDNILNAVRIAEVEKTIGKVAFYYFRAKDFVPHRDEIIHIAAIGHIVGYHYESLDTCHGDMEAAYEDFCHNLDYLRQIAPVTTACAHGSPRSRWNSQDIWKQYDIHTLGIDYEPMLDTDFSTTLYLTDTGRRWDGYKVSVRDKVPQYQKQWTAEGLIFHTTDDIIHALNNIQHPIHQKELLINTHPQRWMPFGPAWMKEAVLQNTKNIVKRVIISTKTKKQKK